MNTTPRPSFSKVSPEVARHILATRPDHLKSKVERIYKDVLAIKAELQQRLSKLEQSPRVVRESTSVNHYRVVAEAQLETVTAIADLIARELS